MQSRMRTASCLERLGRARVARHHLRALTTWEHEQHADIRHAPYRGAEMLRAGMHTDNLRLRRVGVSGTASCETSATRMRWAALPHREQQGLSRDGESRKRAPSAVGCFRYPERALITTHDAV